MDDRLFGGPCVSPGRIDSATTVKPLSVPKDGHGLVFAPAGHFGTDPAGKRAYLRSRAPRLDRAGDRRRLLRLFVMLEL